MVCNCSHLIRYFDKRLVMMNTIIYILRYIAVISKINLSFCNLNRGNPNDAVNCLVMNVVRCD